MADDHERMVREQLEARGIRDRRVLEAILAEDRARYVPAADRHRAYANHPLPLSSGQTISQPYVVGWMTQLAAPGPDDRALDVGTGSGWQAAVLARLCREVHTIERHEDLSSTARERLSHLANVRLHVGDGSLGLPAEAPFDVIVCAAAAADVPPAFRDQLADGGRAVLPVGGGSVQEMVRIVRRGDRFEREDHGPVRFVPLLGAGVPGD